MTDSSTSGLRDTSVMTDVLDITPDPKILVALTRTPLTPLDALCELIDNALDSLAQAENEGEPVRGPIVQVTIPGPAEIARGEGIVRVHDNGPGLTREGIANALRAGWTSKNPFDTLGLFGMGFNIATGKLGQRTQLSSRG
jgi:C4-dicarboxylate-specific signal transduction histidine kinase